MMPHRSPYRVARRLAPGALLRWAGLAMVAGASILLSGTAPRDPIAAPPLKKILPSYAPGFPLLFPSYDDTRRREGAVVAADLDRDGRPELVASVADGVLAVVGEGGAMRPGWPRTFHEWPQPAYLVGAPGVGDLDGNGVDE